MITLKKARLNKKLSQQDVEKKIGVTQKMISLYETNSCVPNLIIAKKLAELYSISLDDIDTRKMKSPY